LWISRVQPGCPLCSNASGKPRGKAWIWRKMYHYFMYQHEEFTDHYYDGRNIETTDFIMKSKFTDLVRSIKTTAK
jgi:hypothetical protein